MAAFLLLAACGRDAETPAARRSGAKRPPSRPCRSSSRRSPTAQDREESGDAAATLKRYYARIEAGDYDAAWAMRSGETGDAARRRFADNFRAYQSYHADVGTPSEPVAGGRLGLCRGAGDDPRHLPRRQALRQRRQRHRPPRHLRRGRARLAQSIPASAAALTLGTIASRSSLLI